jgi:predicted AlkP superfamily phosphohydrolase/phosphomutase
MGAPTGTRRGRLVVIGLDGATFRVLDPLGQGGVMPALSGLRERGVEAILRSTVPAYTPPAWTSMATGVNPGRHGIFGFLASTPQERPSIAHSGLIDAPTMWRYVNDQGAGAGVFHVPMTYPPMSVQGFMVSGGLAAGWTDPEMPNFASDAELGRMVSSIAGGHYPLDSVVSYERDWHSPETVTRLEDIQRLRRTVLRALLERTDPDVLFAVFEGPDRLQHVQYQYIVECSDWYGRPEAAEIRHRAHSYFREVDRAIGELVDWAGTDGHVVVVSDHGAGPWEKTLNLNLLLAAWGYLKLPSISRLTRLGPVAGAGQRLARRVLPRRLLHAAKARVSRGIEWKESRAFASQVAEQGIHLNERGAFPEGRIHGEEVAWLQAEITERLRELVDPDDGQPVVDRVISRDEVMHGPHEGRSPHLFPFLRDQRYELSDTIAAASAFTDHRDRPWGYHHSDGVFVAAGPNAAAGRLDAGLDIVDVLPTVLHLAGFAVPAGLDGHVVDGALSAAAAGRPVVTAAPAEQGDERTTEYPFSRQEEAEIEESLRGLGYLE